MMSKVHNDLKFNMQRNFTDSIEHAEKALRELNLYLANFAHRLSASEAENVSFLIEKQRDAVYQMRMAQAAVELLKVS